MYSDNSILLEQIKTAMHNKWYQSKTANRSFPGEPAKAPLDLDEHNLFTQFRNAQAMEKLEHSIEALERQNNQLLQFINFMLDNLPTLVSTILRADGGSVTGNEQKHNNNTFRPSYTPSSSHPSPTRREKDVLELLVKGFCAKEIAKQLYISETTVITHKKNLKEKFCARNTAELVSKAQSHLH